MRRSPTACRLLGIAVLSFFISRPCVTGCDMCGCYTPQHAAALPAAPSDSGVISSSGTAALWMSGAYLAVAEQFTHFGTLQLEGSRQETPA